jgi:PAS domain-containing protein
MTAPNSPLFNPNSFTTLASLDQAAMDASPEAAYLCAGDGRVLRFNQKAAELCGRTPTVGHPDRGKSPRAVLRQFPALSNGWRAAASQSGCRGTLQANGSFRAQEAVIEEAGCPLPSYFVARTSLSNA